MFRQQSSNPIFRGRELVLNYTSGSPCDSPLTKNSGRSLIGDDDEEHDDEKDHDRNDSERPTRRKSTIITFQCEREPLAPKAHLSFIGASEDECTYIFKARSMAACGGVNETAQSLGPGGVFGVMYASYNSLTIQLVLELLIIFHRFLIAAAVYLFGGIAYQRTVMHQRGWRQLPNYSTWAGIGNFLYVSIVFLSDSSKSPIFTSSLHFTTERKFLPNPPLPGYPQYPDFLLRPLPTPPQRLQPTSHH